MIHYTVLTHTHINILESFAVDSKKVFITQTYAICSEFKGCNKDKF